jgi:hypothetical protein
MAIMECLDSPMISTAYRGMLNWVRKAGGQRLLDRACLRELISRSILAYNKSQPIVLKKF